MRSIVLSILCVGVVAANAQDAPQPSEKDALFSFAGLESLRGPGCVPEEYRLPARISGIADDCLAEVQGGFEDLDALNAELSALNAPDSPAPVGNSVRRFQLGIRDCMSEKMGYVDDSGNFVTERLEAEIAALDFPEPFGRDVLVASRACLRHTPENLSVEQRQNFYYVCRDSLLEANCLYKRLSRDDPERALDIGLKQTQCLDDLQPSLKVLSAMDACKKRYDVPVQYATLRRRRSASHHEPAAEPAPAETVEEEAVEEGSGMPDETGFVTEEEKPPLSERVNLFVHCVHETIGAVREDGRFDAAPLIEELKQFTGQEESIKLQVDAAIHCQGKDSIESFNSCYYDDVSSGCHIFRVQEAFLAGDPSLLPQY